MQGQEKEGLKDRMNETDAQCQRCGVLPKYVMLTPDLTPEAKAIYALLRSHAGNETSVSPDMKMLATQLRITTGRLRSHFDLLAGRGYIREKKRQSGHKSYTFADKPKKLTKEAEQLYTEWKENESICGAVPWSVMADSGVSIMAKALYAYLSAMRNTPANTAKVTKRDLLEHMRITDGRYLRYCRELVAAGYMTVIYHRYVINEYVLHGCRIQSTQNEKERQ